MCSSSVLFPLSFPITQFSSVPTHIFPEFGSWNFIESPGNSTVYPLNSSFAIHADLMSWCIGADFLSCSRFLLGIYMCDAAAASSKLLWWFAVPLWRSRRSDIVESVFIPMTPVMHTQTFIREITSKSPHSWNLHLCKSYAEAAPIF